VIRLFVIRNTKIDVIYYKIGGWDYFLC